MHQPCKTCPFRENPIEPGSAEWLIDIMQGFKKGPFSHSCHLTDQKADLALGDKRPRTMKKRQCIGFLGMLKAWKGDQAPIGNEGVHAMCRAEIDWEKIPTKGVFRSPFDAVRWHCKANNIPCPG